MSVKPKIKMLNFSNPEVEKHIKDRLENIKINGVDGNILEITENDVINLEKQHSLWYGGTVITVDYGCYSIVLAAIGDIICDLNQKSKTDELLTIETVKDKRNGGAFHTVMSKHIKDDKELQSILNYENDKYTLDMQNSNWWEVLIYKNGESIEIDYILDDDLLVDALLNMIKSLDEIIKYVETDE